MSNAIIGTLVLTLYASDYGDSAWRAGGYLPVRIDSKLAAALRVISQTMAGAPSILMGLFAFSFIVHDLNVGFSAIAGSFALAVLMMPVIVISTEIAVRGVPNTLARSWPRPRREAPQGIASNRLARRDSGIVTGSILAMSRAMGETAPVLLAIGGGFINSWKPLDPVSALPLTIFENAKSEWPSQRAQVWGIALVLVAFVFVLSLRLAFGPQESKR